MIEWWQALLMSVATGTVAIVAGLITGWASSRWTAQASADAETRAAEPRIAEERREATRSLRREAVAPTN